MEKIDGIDTSDKSPRDVIEWRSGFFPTCSLQYAASIAQIARFWHEFRNCVGCSAKSLACQRKNINCRSIEKKKERRRRENKEPARREKEVKKAKIQRQQEQPSSQRDIEFAKLNQVWCKVFGNKRRLVFHRSCFVFEHVDTDRSSLLVNLCIRELFVD